MFNEGVELPQQSFLVQPDRINPTVVGWFALYKWHEAVTTGKAKELALRYSRYKYGDLSEISRFGHELQIFIRGLRGNEIQEDLKRWVIFTPPYSSVEPAVRSIGDEIAKAFNIPHIDLRTVSGGDRRMQYAAITDFAARMRAKFSVQTVMDDSIFVEGKNALVIDDTITTGATAAYMNRVLYEKYLLGHVVGFSLVDFVTEDPSMEEFINRFLIVSGDLDSLVTVLNDPRTIINRHTIKSLYGEDRYVLDAIVPRLLPPAIARLEQTRDRYYFGMEIT